jgi:hypothetical protein
MHMCWEMGILVKKKKKKPINEALHACKGEALEHRCCMSLKGSKFSTSLSCLSTVQHLCLPKLFAKQTYGGPQACKSYHFYCLG